jgi:hypothetical protein
VSHLVTSDEGTLHALTATPTVGTPVPAIPGSSPAAPASTMPQVPRQGAGWGAVPPNFASVRANQQGPNPW